MTGRRHGLLALVWITTFLGCGWPTTGCSRPLPAESAGPLAAIGIEEQRARPAELEGREEVFGESEVHGARPPPPLAEIPLGEVEPGLSFFAVGDTGYGGKVLRAVAAGMERSARERPIHFALLLGDNFYPSGVQSLEDLRWRKVFEEPFGAKELAVPFYVVLGNHDHRGKVAIEVEYTQRSERWRMPARWYTFTREVPGVTAQLFALDTDPIEESWADVPGQLRWLEEELAKSSALWKIVFGHHPALSHGRHGGTKELVARVVPLLERHGVDLYVAGHDHDVQLLDSGKGWLQLVSGAGSSTRDVSYGMDTLFAVASPGYARVDLGPKAMWIEIATAAEGPKFRRRVEKR